MKKVRLFSYKITDDTGFAPNPFWGVMTLATCKPLIRKFKEPGDWIAGFTSYALNTDPVGEERLVFLMQVSDKITLSDYFSDPRYQNKKPVVSGKGSSLITKNGDNIYYIKNNEYRKIRSFYHNEQSHLKRDTSGENVLISNQYYYFGGKALPVPDKIKPKIPKGSSPHGYRTYDLDRVNSFLKYVLKKGKQGLNGPPTQWPEADTSWRQDENYS